MKIVVLTLFPEMIGSVLGSSIIGRGLEKGLLDVTPINIRDFAFNKHHSVDDYTYGGGAGMLMQAEPVYQSVMYAKKLLGEDAPVIYLSPQGRLLDQEVTVNLAQAEKMILLCGHYEGIDERVLEEVVTDTISIGDYVLTGGELPAMVLIDAVARFVPGVLHNEESTSFESHTDHLLEYPQYSRPDEWHGKKVPEVLLSGHHKNIEAWRREQSLIRTAERRPDLLEKADISESERNFLAKEKLL